MNPSKQSVELLACPFCNQPAYLQRETNLITCQTPACALRFLYFKIQAWQTRPPAPSPWKPVDDEARNGQTWLLLCLDDQVRQGYYGVDKDWFGWFCSDRLLDTVTHYMPLPKPPQEAGR